MTKEIVPELLFTFFLEDGKKSSNRYLLKLTGKQRLNFQNKARNLAKKCQIFGLPLYYFVLLS